MDYDTAIEATVSRQEAINELAIHSMTPEDIDLFFAEVGDKEEYQGKEILDWLGY